MAYDNATIIFNARIDLMNEGKLTTTGMKLECIDADGEKIIIDEPEELHTFQIWKSIGYSVKKGEHAIVKLDIWRHTGKKSSDVTDSTGKTITIEDDGHFFKKTSAFFAAHQVERIA